MDPLPLAQKLLRHKSITPADDGAQAMLAAELEALGFIVTKLRFGDIENLFAERPGHGAKLCFAGHTDVVPPGDGWRFDPFGAVVADDVLYGRGAADMKGLAVEGTVRVLEWMATNGKIPDFCVVGEPTCRAQLGDVIKIGRRGSLNARITVPGRQGHSAYPHLADNPLHRLIPALAALVAAKLDEGTPFFQPSSLQLTSVDVGNPATNVIPGRATALLNIRFNDNHTGVSLTEWLTETLAAFAPQAELQVHCSGEAFITEPGPHIAALAAAVTAVTGVTPEQNTGGGTSDARFIARYCPVAEFGLVGASIHQRDEAVPVAQLRQLAAVYKTLIESFPS
jgi:succinyl-diaminopimelate desuccinylase